MLEFVLIKVEVEKTVPHPYRLSETSNTCEAIADKFTHYPVNMAMLNSSFF